MIGGSHIFKGPRIIVGTELPGCCFSPTTSENFPKEGSRPKFPELQGKTSIDAAISSRRPFSGDQTKALVAFDLHNDGKFSQLV